jgi:hypothetical protein
LPSTSHDLPTVRPHLLIPQASLVSSKGAGKVSRVDDAVALAPEKRMRVVLAAVGRDDGDRHAVLAWPAA